MSATSGIQILVCKGKFDKHFGLNKDVLLSSPCTFYFYLPVRADFESLTLNESKTDHRICEISNHGQTFTQIRVLLIQLK